MSDLNTIRRNSSGLGRPIVISRNFDAVKEYQYIPHDMRSVIRNSFNHNIPLSRIFDEHFLLAPGSAGRDRMFSCVFVTSDLHHRLLHSVHIRRYAFEGIEDIYDAVLSVIDRQDEFQSRTKYESILMNRNRSSVYIRVYIARRLFGLSVGKCVIQICPGH